MAKRVNPYVEDYIKQSKVHVSLKQLNNNEDRLLKVYEKTLQLLFKGAKTHQNSSFIESSSIRKKDGKKQMFIGKDGRLIQEDSTADLDDKAPLQVKHCICGNIAEFGCSYCEKQLCNSCQQPCACCLGTYCLQCSLAESEGLRICVSCYS